MAARLQALHRQRKVTLRRRGDVNDLRFHRSQHFCGVTENARDTKSFCQLLGHQLFAIVYRHDLAIRNALQRLEVLVGDFAASDDSNLEHGYRIGESN